MGVSFKEDWEWDEQTASWRRICFDANTGTVYEETRQDLSGVFAEVREQERKRDNPLKLERVAVIPPLLMNQLAAEGVPVFDPDEGNEVLIREIRKRGYDFLLTDADKGN